MRSVVLDATQPGVCWRPIIALGSDLLAIGTGGAQGSPIFLVDFTTTPSNSTENTGVSGRLVFEFRETPGGEQLDLTILNTTPAEIGSRLTAVGFEWPTALSALPVFAEAGTSPYFNSITYDVNVHPEWLDATDGYDVIITGDGQFEGGSSQGAPPAGASQTVRLDLGHTGMSPDEWGDAFYNYLAGTPEPWAVARFQSVGPDGELSDKVTGSFGQVPAPEPTSLLLLGLISLVLLACRRR